MPEPRHDPSIVAGAACAAARLATRAITAKITVQCMGRPPYTTEKATEQRQRLEWGLRFIACALSHLSGDWSLIGVHLERGDESLSRNLDAAEAPHLLLSCLLLVEQLALARDVAAIAFRGHILAQRADGLARDHLRSDRRLDRDLEQMAREQILQLVDHGTAACLCA